MYAVCPAYLILRDLNILNQAKYSVCMSYL
jgi:hypothetical protein